MDVTERVQLPSASLPHPPWEFLIPPNSFEQRSGGALACIPALIADSPAMRHRVLVNALSFPVQGGEDAEDKAIRPSGASNHAGACFMRSIPLEL